MNENKPISEIFCPGKKVRIESVNCYGNKIITQGTVRQLDDQSLILNLQKQEGIFHQVHTGADVTIVCYEESHDGITGAPNEIKYIFSSQFIRVRDENPHLLIVSVPVLSSGDTNAENQKREISLSLPFSYFVEDKEVKGGTVKYLTVTGLIAFVKHNPSLEVGLGLPFKLSLPTGIPPLLMIGTITGLHQEGDGCQITLDFSHTPHEIQDQITKFLYSLAKPVIKRERKPKNSFIKIK